ncbi:hypothetical protein B0T26DRAFT_673566 [Lasiosphaeria miniovina]|uniref:Uncharacterized protein n=1 Tax=Lasiosphaeria miniovina TaxID=1954250 RepID=A0AA40ATS5_9PEZI|nr:uncharacterized protein B0T26DRAFT_673566 [Lasiosphaeria miniovina]KAK0721782.1 hypothetical protein B0T26DRAFT_673566 [Lasiosphaeria miniovina]
MPVLFDREEDGSVCYYEDKEARDKIDKGVEIAIIVGMTIVFLLFLALFLSKCTARSKPPKQISYQNNPADRDSYEMQPQQGWAGGYYPPQPRVAGYVPHPPPVA